MVKHKDTMISAFADAFPSNTQVSHEQMYESALVEALQVSVWGSDYQLLPFSLLMNRPVFQYNTFFISDTSGITTLTLSDARDLARFMAYDPSTRGHVLYCGNIHRILLASGDVNTLPNMPLCMLPTSGWLCCYSQIVFFVTYLFPLQVYLLTEPCSTLEM